MRIYRSIRGQMSSCGHWSTDQSDMALSQAHFDCQLLALVHAKGYALT
jgi:hypothetical protein